MIKKMMLLAMAVGALVALAAPAAQAIELKEGGKALKTGVEVTATSTNLVTTTASGTLSCELVTIHGTLAKNGPAVEIKPTTTTTKNCSINAGEKGVHSATITSPAVGTISVVNQGVGSASAVTFLADIPDFALECHFSGTAGFTYVSGSSTLTVAAASSVLTGSGTNCPTSGTLEGSFSLETSNGTAVTISN
jgi:hypothetical protein